MSEQWIEQMQQKMAGYKRPAPEVSWEEIDRVLSANKARKTRILWLRRIAAVAILLLIAGLGYWEMLPDVIEQEQPTIVLVKENHGDILHDLYKKQEHEPLHSDPITLAGLTKESDTTETSILKSHYVIPDSVASTDTNIITASSEDEQLLTIGETAESTDISIPIIHSLESHHQKHSGKQLKAKFYMSSTLADSQTESLIKKQGGTISSSERHVVHHSQPMRFGLSIRYYLNDCWSVESGLLFTHLFSKITTTEDGMPTMFEQRLNYIGLPLNVSYDLWKSKYFGVYVTAGSTIEKRLDASPWQFSLNGSAGAEYKLTNFFSLYVEPGLGYYFKDGSTTPTIYQDHPLNFNLSLGLRFNLK